MSMDHCVHILDRACVAALVALHRPQAAFLILVGKRLALHQAPIIIGTVSVNQAHQAIGRLHFHSQRQRGECLAYALLLEAIQLLEPVATMHCVAHVRIGVPKGAAPSHQIMIAADSVEPGLVQPFQHQVRFWAAIDKITDRKQAVRRRLEVDCI